jgi:hypothetical protein
MSGGLLDRRAVRGATALSGGRFRRPTPFQVFGFLCWLVLSLTYWATPLGRDAGLHAAVVERLVDDLWRPRHPLADLPGAGSPYYSPYAVLQGLFARWTGLGGWEVVRLAGPLNLLVLLTGLGRLVRVLTPRPWAPVLALPVLAVAGDPGRPAACALGLTFWAWAVTGARARGDLPLRSVGAAGLGVLYGVIALVDPVTAVAAVAGAGALVVGWQRGWGRAVVGVRWAAAGGGALRVAAGWPYVDFFDVVAPDRVPFPGFPWRLWPALLGLPALWLRRWRRDPLVLMSALGCLVAACGYGGVLVCVPLVLAAAVELAAPRPWSRWRKGYAAVVAVGVCAGLLTVPTGPVEPTYVWAARHVGRGEVVLTGDYRAARALAGYGATTVAPDPMLKDLLRGHGRDVRAFLSPASTRADRTAVLRRHRVRWLLLTRQDRMPEEAVLVAWSERTGEVLARVAGGGG